MNLLIQGPPKAGKTTAITTIAKFLPEVAGFYTAQIREGGVRVGFQVESFEGQKKILAHKKCKSPDKVGKYGVNVKNFESVAIPALKNGIKRGQILLIDEIGKMEMYSEKFRKEMVKALNSPNPLVATIPQKMTSRIKKVLENKSFRIIQITRENREQLPSLVLNLLNVKNKN